MDEVRILLPILVPEDWDDAIAVMSWGVLGVFSPARRLVRWGSATPVGVSGDFEGLVHAPSERDLTRYGFKPSVVPDLPVLHERYITTRGEVFSYGTRVYTESLTPDGEGELLVFSDPAEPDDGYYVPAAYLSVGPPVRMISETAIRRCLAAVGSADSDEVERFVEMLAAFEALVQSEA